MFDVLAPLRDLRAAMALPFAVAALALIAAPAQATLTPVSPPSPVGGPGTAESEFAGPAGVAVNRTTGDVYVADTANNRVQRFTDHGAFISAFGWGVTDGSNALQTCTNGCEAGVAGNGNGQLSNPTGIAVDPSSGDVYVADQGNSRIVRYSAAGAYVGEFGDSGFNPLTSLISGGGITFGPDGNLYVIDGGRIAVFDPAGNAQANFPGQGFVVPQALALDSTGNVFVPDTFYGAAVQEYSPSGSLLRVLAHEGENNFGALAATTAAAVNLGNDHVFIAERGDFDGQGFRLIEFDSAGHRVNKSMASQLVGATTGMAYNPAASLLDDPGALYVADSAESRLVILAPLVAAPTIRDVRPVAVKAVTANLTATVNPNFRDTQYRFEYGTSTSYGATTPAAPGADLGHSGDDEPVTAKLSGLAPSTTYHFRAVAHNSRGTTTGPDRTFTTDVVGGPLGLPDNRAYEQITPVVKNGAEVVGPDSTIGPTISHGSADGSSLAYMVAGVYPGGHSSARLSGYLSAREGLDWATREIEPHLGPPVFNSQGSTFMVSADMSKALVSSTLALAPGAVADAGNIYVRDNRTGAYQTLATDPEIRFGEFGETFAGGSADFSHVVLQTDRALTPDAVAGVPHLYDWSDGHLRLVDVLPDGTPAPQGGGTATQLFGQTGISADGRRILFSSGGMLYLRKNGTTTVPVSVSHRSSDGGTPASAQAFAMSSDGTKVFLTSAAPLTDDARANRTELYRYNVDDDTMTNLTVGVDIDGPADGQSVTGVMAISESGTTVYFTAQGAGSSKLYVRRDGAVHRVIDDAALSFYGPNSASVNGRYFLLTLSSSPTGGDTGGPPQIYRYDADTQSIACASCRPTGELSGTGPTLSTNAFGTLRPFIPRNVTDTGRVFFQSTDALVPQDTNGQQDVYEWEGGRQHLISDGKNSHPSYFLDASVSGDDVFVSTRARLVGQDNDSYTDIYDARVDGGLKSQNPDPAAPPCTGDACQDASADAPAAPTVATVAFSSPGDDPVAARVTSKARVTGKQAKGPAFTLTVKVPNKGRIVISGAGLRTTKKTATRAASYRLTVQLTASAKRTLKRKHRLTVKARVSYAPAGRSPSTTTVSVTLKA